MIGRLGSAALGAMIGALVFGLTADGATVLVAPPARHAAPTPVAVEPEIEVATASKPVRRAKSACRLIVGWPDCAVRKPKPVPAPQPASPPPAPQAPACDSDCLAEKRANTPAERPAPQPDYPEMPDDEGIDLGTVTPPPDE